MVQLVTSSFIKSNNSIGNNSNVPKDIPRVEEPARTFEFINRQDLLNLFNQNSRTVQFLQASDTIDNKDFNDLLNLYYEELVKHVKDVEAKKINCAENFELCKETLEGYTGGIDSQKTTMIFYEIKRKEILPYTNTQDFIDKARFLTIPKIRTIKTEDKFNSFLQYPVGLIGYLDPTGDNQFETIKELTVLGRKYSNVFFQIGNIPANAISQDQTFHDEIRTGGYGYYQTLNLPGSEKPVIRKYPYNNPDYQALTVWVEVESLPDIIEQNHENFNRIFRGSIHTHVVLFMPESESQNNQNLTNELTKASRYNREEDLFYHRAIYIVCKYGTDQEFEHAYGVHDHNQPRLFVTSTHKGDFMRYRLEETEKITEDSINSLLQGAINRSIDPIYLSEPVELMSILKGAEQESNVRKIVADSFKKEVLKSDKNQILMLCNEKERCDYFVQTFIYLSNLMKGTGVEFLFMNGDYNEVSLLSYKKSGQWYEV